MIKKFKLFAVVSSTILCCIIPFTAEARGGFNGIITQIKDPKAMEAYVKEAKQLEELYEHTKRLQQSLEKFNFRDLQQTYNFLNDSMEDFEKIQKDFAGMSVTISEMEDNWDELNPEYDSKTITPEKKAELDKKREERHTNSNKLTSAILKSINDAEKMKKGLGLVKEDMSLLESSKSSPVKAIQALGQLSTHMLNEIKRSQKVSEENLRRQLEKDQREEDEKKQAEAEHKRQASIDTASIDAASKKFKSTNYSSSALTYEEMMDQDK